ncbi:MAG: hypothetical protein U0704_02910 [Candidatus Eisenbacteria bacterium]
MRVDTTARAGVMAMRMMVEGEEHEGGIFGRHPRAPQAENPVRTVKSGENPVPGPPGRLDGPGRP